ncbi:MAG: alanine dehydrogenase [Crocinitomicaceae bacterium]|nr:alanine dehydrogenase [Crocinitomicaceae bacterium]
MKLGIIREGKVPPDMRVPLSPQQCVQVQEKYPHVKIKVQTSPIRAFKDEEYTNLGIEVVEDISDCDIIMGVKEVNLDDLIPSKKFLFFSHTFKLQPYNRKLLQEIIKQKIQLIDYEVMTTPKGRRLIGFGRYAGIVGCYNGFLTYGKKTGKYDLKPANQCADRKEMEGELKKIQLESNAKILLTGHGRVGKGAREIIDQLDIKEVSAEDYLSKEFDHPVFAHIDVHYYNVRKSDGGFDKKEFYNDPSGYESTFPKFLAKTDMYIACHYWDSDAPFLFTREDAKELNRTKVVADISCDIDGPIASTIRPSKIADPIYGYDPQTESEADFKKEGVIAVMAVDNLPCELPKDASIDFGNELLANIFDSLFVEDKDEVIYRASETTLEGKLNEPYEYLQDYLEGKE